MSIAAARHLAASLCLATAWAVIGITGVLGVVSNVWLVFAILRM